MIRAFSTGFGDDWGRFWAALGWQIVVALWIA